MRKKEIGAAVFSILIILSCLPSMSMADVWQEKTTGQNYVGMKGGCYQMGQVQSEKGTLYVGLGPIPSMKMGLLIETEWLICLVLVELNAKTRRPWKRVIWTCPSGLPGEYFRVEFVLTFF